MTLDDRFIGIDIGGTKILGVIASARQIANGELATPDYVASNHVQIATPNGGGDELARAVLGLVEALCAGTVGRRETSRRGSAVAGVGVGLPGLVDRDGILRFGPHLPGIIGFDMADALSETLAGSGLLRGLVSVNNDATNAALAEHSLGAAVGHENAIVVTQGTGIGCGLIVNGEVVRGSNGFAGEPGHWRVDPEGFACACGLSGCWETVSSGAGLRNLALAAVQNGAAKMILALADGRSENIEGVHVGTAAALGDQDALDIFSAFARWTASGLGGLVSILDPSIIVLGGGLLASKQFFLDEVSAELSNHVMGGSYRPSVPVVPAKLGPSAGAIGGLINVSAQALKR